MTALSDSHAGWAEVDLEAITGNVEVARRVSGVAVMAVVKADGYGHGAAPVARAALRGGASRLGVARASEALALRAAGIDAPLLLLGHTPPDAVAGLVEAGVALTVWAPEHLAALPAGARVHLKVDTGMSRLGVAPDGALELARGVRHLGGRGVELEGVFTHFACADDRGSTVTAGQQEVFSAVVARLEAAGLRPPLVHAANSAATLAVPGAAWDLVRFGIAMYGLSPGEQVVLPEGIRPALAWKTVIAQVKDLPPGRGVSYGHTYTTGGLGGSERIGTMPVGYADGFRRGVPNEVLVRGVRVPVVGRVCMDQCMVRLDDVPDAAVGDEVVLIGAQGEQRISADDVAARWGTIGYEVVCGIGHRVPRISPALGA